MDRFFCYGKKDFCNGENSDCNECSFRNDNGGVEEGLLLEILHGVFGDDYDLDRLRELVEADRDGLCVVLPCKIGTPVYRILWHCGCAAMDDESYKYVSFPVPFAFDMINQFGKSVFLTSEEADEAMKERRR